MQTQLAILLPFATVQRMHSHSGKVLMESWRSSKKNHPTNRSNPREVPRTKIERTISLRLIHTYNVDDPAGLRLPELGATGVERREEQPFEGMVEIGSKEKEREGAALRQRTILIVC